MSVATLHWIISDKNESIIIEFMEDGLHIYDNEFGVHINNPQSCFRKENIRQYMNISNKNPTIIFLNHFL